MVCAWTAEASASVATVKSVSLDLVFMMRLSTCNSEWFWYCVFCPNRTSGSTAPEYSTLGDLHIMGGDRGVQFRDHCGKTAKLTIPITFSFAAARQPSECLHVAERSLSSSYRTDSQGEDGSVPSHLIVTRETLDRHCDGSSWSNAASDQPNGRDQPSRRLRSRHLNELTCLREQLGL